MNTYTPKELKPLQTKTIAKICRGKLYAWAKTVEKKERADIAEIIKTKTMITGGALVSLLSGEPVNDFDVYFRDKESALKVAQYYVELFKSENTKWVNDKVSRFEAVEEENTGCIKIIIQSAGVAGEQEQTNDNPVPENTIETTSPTEYQYFEQTNGDEAETFLQSLTSFNAKKEGVYSPVFLSDNAITLSDQIQLVIRFYGEPEEIHKNYDFVHCTNIYTSWDDKVTLNMEAMESIRVKKLKYVGSLYPICSILRLRKFIARGWSINAGQVLKIIWQIKDLDLNDINVLSEQLIGVDQAFFTEVIDILKQDKAEGKQIDQTYLSQLLDTVFE